MFVNLFTATALSLVALAAPAGAATISAEIVGRDVEVRFLAGAFIPLPSPGSPDSVTQTSDTPTQSVTVDRPAANEASFSDPVIADAGRSFDPPTSSLSGGMTDSNNAPGVTLSTVPLPPAMPMFGAALLALIGLGRLRRRRAVPGT